MTPLWVLLAVQTAADLDELLDSADPELREWAERAASAPPRSGEWEEILERGFQAETPPSRRFAIVVAVEANAERATSSDDRSRWFGAAFLTVRVQWDALFVRPPPLSLWVPALEQRRRARCERLEAKTRWGGERGRETGSTTAKPGRAAVARHAAWASAAALGCEGLAP